jgi:transcriptional regulator with XRE-family HTH domain
MAKNRSVFGERIFNLRTRKHLTQEGLSDESGVSQAEISRIERGHASQLSRETITKLAQAFEITPESLVRGTSFAPDFGQAESVTLSSSESNPFTAYFASALTGLNDEQLSEIIELDERVDQVCADYSAYRLLLYRPRLKTSPKDQPDIEARRVYEIDQERVTTSDLLIAATVFPSLGAGMELQLALQSGASIILLVKEGQPLSRMVTGCPARMVVAKYRSLDDLAMQLITGINELLPGLADYRFQQASSQHGLDDFSLGDRVRTLRERRNIDIPSLARMVGVGNAYIENLESHPEQISNPSLRLIRRLSRALSVSETFLISGHELPIQYRIPVFDEHLQALRVVADKTVMSANDFDNLWKAHVDKYQYDLSVTGASNRSTIGGTEYWKERYDDLQTQASGPKGLF